MHTSPAIPTTMPKSVSKTCFNVVFLVFNLCFLASNLGWFNKGESADSAAQEQPQPRSYNGVSVDEAIVIVPGESGRRTLQEDGGAGSAGYKVKLKRPNPWEQDWDSRQIGAIARRVADGKGPLRRIWLVRHGDYFRQGAQQGHLTPTGKKQVGRTAQRLKDFGIRFDAFISSTSVRAKETTEILISKNLNAAKVEWSDLLKEGRPTYPDPDFPIPVAHDKSFDEDGLRFDLAFRKYMHRADPDVKQVTNELIVAHGNVIGYFTLRGLQVPVERWLKLQVIQGSISMYEITSDGHFNVRILGDMGHIPVSDWTG